MPVTRSTRGSTGRGRSPRGSAGAAVIAAARAATNSRRSGGSGGRHRNSRAAPANNNNNNSDAASDTTELALSDEVWDVNSIQSKRIDATGHVSYLVDWKGYSGEPTWEPEENCRDCQGAISEFEAKVSRRQSSLSMSRPSTSSGRSCSPQISKSSRKNTKSLKLTPDRYARPCRGKRS